MHGFAGMGAMTSYCSSACFRSSSSCCSCSKASWRACSLMTRWFSSSCFSASVVWMACCCSRCHFSSSALLADSSSNSLQHGQLRVTAPDPEDDKAQQSLRGAWRSPNPPLAHKKDTRSRRGPDLWVRWPTGPLQALFHPFMEKKKD